MGSCVGVRWGYTGIHRERICVIHYTRQLDVVNSSTVMYLGGVRNPKNLEERSLHAVKVDLEYGGGHGNC